MIGLHVGTGVGLEFELLHDLLLGTHEAHREEDELGGDDAGTALDFLRRESTVVIDPLDVADLEPGEVASLVFEETLRVYQILARIGTLQGGGLFLAVVHLVDLRPFGPGIVRGALHRGHRHDLKLDDALAAVAEARADAVGSGIATTDDDDVLALRVQRRDRSVEVVVELVARVLGEELHREVDALGVTPFGDEITPERGPAAEDDGVEILAEFFGGPFGILTDVHLGLEGDALGGHEINAALHDFLLVELHVRDAVHEESADAVGALEDRHFVTGLIELVGAGETGGTGSDHGDFLAGAGFGNAGRDPAFFPALVDDGAFVVLDRHGGFDHAENTGSLTRRGADPAGELGEVVRLVETIERLAPAAAEDEIVPLGNEVVDGTAARHAGDDVSGVAERRAAIHATRALGTTFLVVAVDLEFLPVLEAFDRVEFGVGLASDLHESSWLAHPKLFSFQFSVFRIGKWGRSLVSAGPGSGTEK